MLGKPLDPDHTLQTWFVLERCDGGSLASLLADRRRELAMHQHQRHSPNHPNHHRTTSKAISRKVTATEYGRIGGAGDTAGPTDSGGCTAAPHCYTPPGSTASEVYGPSVTGAGAAAAAAAGAAGAVGSRLRRGSADQCEAMLAAAVAAAAAGGSGASGATMVGKGFGRRSMGVSSEQGVGAPGGAEVDGGGWGGVAAAGRPVALLPLVSSPVPLVSCAPGVPGVLCPWCLVPLVSCAPGVLCPWCPWCPVPLVSCAPGVLCPWCLVPLVSLVSCALGTCPMGFCVRVVRLWFGFA